MKNPDLAKAAHLKYLWCKANNLPLLAQHWRKTRNQLMRRV